MNLKSAFAEDSNEEIFSKTTVPAPSTKPLID